MDLYFTSTPYHILTCTSIAIENESKAHLICAPSFKDPNAFFEAFRSWDGNPFNEITRLTSTYDRSLSSRWAIRTFESLRARKLAEKHDPERVYVTNDPSPTEQSLLNFSPKDSVKIYVEDGTAAYTSRKLPERATWKRIGGKILFGTWWEPVNVYGTSSWIDQIAVTHPKCVRPELDRYPKREISPKYLSSMNVGWVEEYFTNLEYNLERLNNIESIVVPPISKVCTHDEREEFRQLLLEEANTSNVAVKYHPREPEEDYLDVEENGIILPQTLPSELLYVIMPNLSTVIGSVSTAILSAKWVDKNLRVISIADLLNVNDPHMMESLRDMNVEIR